MSDFCTVSDVMARKQHMCRSCGTSIDAGAMYKRVSGSNDGVMFSYAEHAECHAVECAYNWRETYEGDEWAFLIDVVGSEQCMIDKPVSVSDADFEVVEKRLSHVIRGNQ